MIYLKCIFICSIWPTRVLAGWTQAQIYYPLGPFPRRSSHGLQYLENPDQIAQY